MAAKTSGLTASKKPRSTKAKTTSVTTEVAAKEALEKATKIVAEEAAEPEKVEEMVSETCYKLGDYKILIKPSEDSIAAKWELISEGEAIVASGFNVAETMEYPGLKTIQRSAAQKALESGIKAYNSLFPFSSGEISIHRLFPSPVNLMLYDPNSSLEDIKKLMEKGVELDEITVTAEGEILRGNTRFLASLLQNAEAKSKNEPMPHFTFKVKVVQGVDSFEEKLEYIRQGNTYRVKTPADLKREALIAAKALACKPADLKALVAEAAKTGTSQRQMENLTALERLIKQDGLITAELATNLRNLATTNPTTAIDIARVKPPEGLGVPANDYRKAIAEKIPEGQAVKGKNHSFAAAKAMVDKELVVNSVNDELVKRALSFGDKPESNRHTPPAIIELARLAMGEIDLDVFASLPNPDYVSSLVGYQVESWTIQDDAWTKPIRGKVFANPPWHRATEALVLIDQWLRRGITAGISKCFLVIPLSVMSSKAVQRMIKDFGLMVCTPDYRIEYEPGQVLLSTNPEAATGNIRDATLVLFFSFEEKDYDVLADNFPGWCGRQHRLEMSSKPGDRSEEPEQESL